MVSVICSPSHGFILDTPMVLCYNTLENKKRRFYL